MNNDTFVRMRDVGRVFGKTNHDVGRLLKHHGYRSVNGKPTAKAFECQLIRAVWSGDYYSWDWSLSRTTALLETFGWKRKSI
jgi:hypothetical protein